MPINHCRLFLVAYSQFMNRKLAVLSIFLTLLDIWSGVSVHASLATTAVFLIVYLLVFNDRLKSDS